MRNKLPSDLLAGKYPWQTMRFLKRVLDRGVTFVLRSEECAEARNRPLRLEWRCYQRQRQAVPPARELEKTALPDDLRSLASMTWTRVKRARTAD